MITSPRVLFNQVIVLGVFFNTPKSENLCLLRSASEDNVLLARDYFFFVTESLGPAHPLIWRLNPSGSLTWKLE